MSFDITDMEPNEVSINLKLFQQFRFFHLFNPKTKKFCNFNVYHLALYIINCVIGCTIIIGLMSYFTLEDDTLNIADDVQSMFCCLLYIVCLIKMTSITYKANIIWKLLHVTSIRFLTSTQCQKHVGILKKYRQRSIKITNYISVFSIITTIQWCFFPLALMLLQKEDANQSNRRFENIFNFRFPVTTVYYNNNYFIFYFIEVSIIMILLYTHILSDIFFISLCYVMIAQFKMIKRAYENVNSELNSENNSENKNDNNVNDCFDDLVSIMEDQQKQIAMLKLFHITYKFIILSNVVSYSGSIIILTYAFAVIFTSSESLPMFSTIRLISSFGNVIVVLLIFCHLLERINNNMKFVHFGMYSSNWTSMNLRSKKMLLLSMQLNNANELMIKITPKKIVDPQFFSSVIITCYNILSAMLNISSK
ncbi:uncharacterized protein LOC113554633 [Rhopalosiphum maidis]|uniref:uncharacterized protein LOC113554633 n=1 Tax=Rhopalosiphum maidis TaxID=43146 RepID=UPI000EFDBF0B|nr:uncharacterized protein LOC113554633 [Rhopalosiphum maidis]